MHISTVRKMIDECYQVLVKRFQDYPNVYFTENDIVCAFYHEVVEYCEANGIDLQCTDRDGSMHFLLHMEYPTPFRCDMHGNRFKIADEGSNKRRGHYDFVILNPEFVKENSYVTIKGQDYEKHKEGLSNSPIKEVLLFAIEFMFQREPITDSRPKAPQFHAAKEYAKKTQQDYDKLIAGHKKNCYIEDYRMFVFVRQHEDDYVKEIKKNVDKEIVFIALE